ncbi:hypothetical protein EBT31_06250 [bacterium]|nr:hypothetical protein [bacterium]
MDPQVWQRLPRDLYIHIARLADSETRRAMGFTIDDCIRLNIQPNKLHAKWSEFVPKTMGNEEFWYITDTKTLVYYEIFQYGQIYYEYMTNIEPVKKDWDEGFCKWRALDGSRSRGVSYGDTRINEYDVELDPVFREFQTAGFPVLVARRYPQVCSGDAEICAEP